MQKKYKGLSNIGATCYMNSLLQTLFMTPQFRYGIYNWKYNPKYHPKQSDSILYQLQNLFGKLETGFPGEITTKDLVKSFQWEDEEAQMQQDIQQFNRLLFEALQKSINLKSEKYLTTDFVKDFFEGQLVHYTKCLQCQNESIREEYFQDLIVTVKNIYEKVYNSQLQLGVQRYLKPELLDNDNKYECSQCAKKVVAQRGARFIKMPKILNIILQRFHFNYFTMQRQKINDSVSFPHVLNFNNYINGYAEIPEKEKLNEDSSEYFKAQEKVKKPTVPKFNSTSTKPRVPMKKKTTSNSTAVPIAGKTTTKSSANTKSFLTEMRKRKLRENNAESNEDLIFVSGSMSAQEAQTMSKAHSMNEKNEQKPSSVEKKSVVKSDEYMIAEEEVSNQDLIKEKSEVINAENVKQSKAMESTNQSVDQTVSFEIEEEQKSEQKQQSKKKTTETTSDQTPSLLPPPLNLPPQQLSVPYKNNVSSTSTKTNDKALSIQEEIEIKRIQKEKLAAQKQQKLKELKEKNNLLKQQYLKQGPLVYELYAVMVHNGSANHGHYYSYIQSFEDEKWYCFNDQKVTLVNVMEIQKTFGSGNSNAYALYYRRVDEGGKNNLSNGKFKEDVQQQNEQPLNSNSLKKQIPEYITQKLQTQRQLIAEKQQTKFQNLQNIIVLKIYHQLYVKQLEVYKSNTLSLVTEKARQLYNIPPQVDPSNTRLRMFNPVSDTKLETYGSRESLTLQELKIGSYKSLLLEIKNNGEQFEEYEVGSVYLRVVMLEENKHLNSLDEMYLKSHKVAVKLSATIEDILKAIQKKRKQIFPELLKDINNEPLCLIKRHQNNDETIHEIVSVPEYRNKTMDELNILENELLFLEPMSEKLIWPHEFEVELYRITIRFNQPGTTKYENYLTDSRIPIEQLKQELCSSAYLNTPPEDLIMRWGTKSGRELKDLKLTLKEARFVNGTQVYFDFGIPALPGQTRIQLYLATQASSEVFNRLHEFEYITDVPIHGNLRASEVKEKFAKVLQKQKGMSLNPAEFRIRERVADKIGKIYRERPMREQQLIEKRQIAIELVPETNLDSNFKEFEIYVRIWDQRKWTLSDKIQIKVARSTTMKQVAQNIASQNQHITDCKIMQVCRILSIHKFNIIDLTAMEWHSMNEEEILAIAEPMFVNADGLLYVVKSGIEEPRDLTKEEEHKFGGRVKPAVVRNKPRSYQPKEVKSMKIKVMEKEEDEEEIGPSESNAKSENKLQIPEQKEYK